MSDEGLRVQYHGESEWRRGDASVSVDVRERTKRRRDTVCAKTHMAERREWGAEYGDHFASAGL